MGRLHPSSHVVASAADSAAAAGAIDVVVYNNIDV